MVHDIVNKHFIVIELSRGKYERSGKRENESCNLGCLVKTDWRLSIKFKNLGKGLSLNYYDGIKQNEC